MTPPPSFSHLPPHRSILSCPRLHSDYVRALAWLHGADNDGDDDGRVLLTGGWDGELRALGMA